MRVIVATAVLVWAVNVNALTVSTTIQKQKEFGMEGIKNLISGGMNALGDLIHGTKMDNILRDNYGLSNETINNYANIVSGIESSYGENLDNPKTTAKGIYQFTDDGFKTAIQRTKNVYEANGYSIPLWLSKAEEIGVKNLKPEQQKDLFLGNLQQQLTNKDNDLDETRSTTELLKAFEDGDKEAGYNLFAIYHHTDPDKDTKDRGYKFFDIES